MHLIDTRRPHRFGPDGRLKAEVHALQRSISAHREISGRQQRRLSQLGERVPQRNPALRGREPVLTHLSSP